MNQVSLIGRLVRPIQVQQVNGERQVCNNTLAVQRLRKADEGQPQADFIPVVFWGANANLVEQYVLARRDKRFLILLSEGLTRAAGHHFRCMKHFANL